MNAEFTTIIQTLAAEQGKDALFNAARCKSILADYTRNEYKKESRLLLQVIEAGVAEALSKADDIASCKAQAVRKLQDEYYLAENIAQDVVDMLSSVLATPQAREAAVESAPKCAKCGKELQSEWKMCPYCGAAAEVQLAIQPAQVESIQQQAAAPISQAATSAPQTAPSPDPVPAKKQRNALLIAAVVAILIIFLAIVNSESNSHRGPAGGWIFYDKGAYSEGWRYLEAAPAEREFFNIAWGSDGTDIQGTQTAVGTGKQNTRLIIDALSKKGESGKAAQLCAALNVNGYEDWFLPSKDELNLMYKNLKKKGLGGFDWAYWSSSQYTTYSSWYQNFSNGTQYRYYKDFTHSVRAVRAF
jgi:hypothetical protein